MGCSRQSLHPRVNRRSKDRQDEDVRYSKEPLLTWNCQLAANSLAIKVAALLDTSTAEKAFIHKKHFEFVKKHLQLYIRTAQRPVLLADYNNQNAEVIFRAFTANLVIDRRQIPTHFLFCNTGRHDVLIRRKWFKKTKVLIDCFNQKLIWPEKAQYQASRDLIVLR